MMLKKEIEHINHALVAKAHTPMYLMHKYWARKPHNVVSEYIKHYSKEGDIVLDPFCGSGVTAIEAIKLGRKAIAIDLDPIATLITRMTVMPVDLKKFEKAFKEIEKNVKGEIEKLYETKCERCGKKAIILATIWERKKTEPIELRYFCGTCKKRRVKKPEKEDIELIEKIEQRDIPYWYPTTRLAYNSLEFKEGAHIEGIDQVDKLFTKRNLLALSIIYNQIDKVSNKKTKDLMKFTFTSMTHLASKMCPVAKPSPNAHWSELSATSFWAVHRYWIAPLSMESNVWMLFESAVRGKQGVLKGKDESDEKIKVYKEAKSFDDLREGDANIFIKTHNAIELHEILEPNSVDYVFTDPPYGGAIQYFELSTLWASWLKGKNGDKEFDLDFDSEITINKQQKKDFDYYHNMLKAAFRQVYLALKPGKYMTVTFHSTDISVWNSIIRAVVLSGFNLEKIVYQPPARPSAKGLLQPYGSAVGDYYIRFKKPEGKKLETEKQMDMQSYEREVVMSARGIIISRGEPTIYQHILNGIMVDLNGGRNAPIGARNIDEVLKDHVGKEFELIPVKDNKGKILGKKWWIKGMDLSSQNFTEPALSDRIERAILHLLNKKIKVSFDDVLQAIFMQFPNALTPDTQSIVEILEEYAKKTNGKWMLKAGFTEQEMISEHSKMIYFLANLGKKAGFEVWIGSQEQGRSYNKKPLSELSDPYVTFRNIISSERAKQIDVIWHDTGRIKYAFEIENTTGITDAIIRGSNLRPSVEGMDLCIKKFIITPERRSKLLQRKLNEPLIKDNLKKDKWNFIFYNDLEEFYNKNKRSKEINVKKLEKIAKLPKLNNEKQANLVDYQKG
jgi:DNA modification methylase